MIQDESANQLCLGGGPMLHFHDFNHMKIDGISPLIFGVCSMCEQMEITKDTVMNLLGVEVGGS